MKTVLMAAIAVASAYGSAAYAGGGVQDVQSQSFKSAQATPTAVAAPASPYRFELMSRPLQNGGIGKMHQADSESLVFVRLVRIRDGAPVTDAAVALLRVDMAPDGMGEMTARSYIRPYGSPGTYKVEIHPLMAGQWAVTLAARPSDQSEPLRQVLTVALAK